MAGAGGRRGEGAVPSQNGAVWQNAAHRLPVLLPAPSQAPKRRGAVQEGRRHFPSREVGGGDTSSFPG